MVERRWVDNVQYSDYAPTTIEYDAEVDAFTVARADIHTSDRRFRISLIVVISDQTLRAERLSIDAAIGRGRTLLQGLVQEHRSVVDQLTSSTTRVFDFSGPRLR
jgi:hypothetical protein